MERRVLLAIILCFGVLYVWQTVFVKRQTPTAATASSQSATGATGTPAPAALPATVPSKTAETGSDATPLVSDAQERVVTIETADLIVTFTNRGARLKSWRLKRYKDSSKQPLELVATDLAATQPMPFSLVVSDESVTRTINSGLFVLDRAPPSGVISTSTDLQFEYKDSTGLRATKQFRLEPSGYQMKFRGTVALNDRPLAPAVEWGPGLGDADSVAGRYAVKPGGLLSTDDGKIQRLSSSNILKQPVYDQTFQYAGVDDHYFMTVVLNPGHAKVTYQPVSIPSPEPKGAARDLVAYSIEPAQAADWLTFYVGPKDFNQLASVNRELVRAINFGMFAVIVVPLLRSLNWIYGYLGNYGWSIVGLTILINAIMFPLRHKSVVSMRKMQEIQPEMKAIQDRYAKLKATDPAKQKMNQEMMALYRERGVNPASGCVPMLLTMPVLYAFYALLTTAIEMRGAPFAGWIHDLSLPDPYYVTPILMGASQVWQQRLTPATGADPAQQKMMMMMPIVFTFIFLSAPSGVAVYWLVSNLWGIGQQYLTNSLIGPPKIHKARPAAERQVKRVGGGKSDAARENG